LSVGREFTESIRSPPTQTSRENVVIGG